MNEEIKKRLDRLFEEIEHLSKEVDIFQISGTKSAFTKDVEELRGMHESVTRDYQEYQAAGREDLEQFRNSLLQSSEEMENKVMLVKKSFEERKK